jgi:hypothetical protein
MPERAIRPRAAVGDGVHMAKLPALAQVGFSVSATDIIEVEQVLSG